MNGIWESDIKSKTKECSIRKEQLTRTHAGESSGNAPVEILLMAFGMTVDDGKNQHCVVRK